MIRCVFCHITIDQAIATCPECGADKLIRQPCISTGSSYRAWLCRPHECDVTIGPSCLQRKREPRPDDSQTVCVQCGKPKGADEFLSSAGKTVKTCLDCRVKQRVWDEHYRSAWRRPLALPPSARRLCRKCKALKPLTEFVREGGKSLTKWCTDCRMANNAEQQAKRAHEGKQAAVSSKGEPICS